MIIGLLGGIGSGKSAVSKALMRHGAEVLDADRCAGELLDHARVRDEIREAFGDAVFGADGVPDRSKLADLVFASERNRATLNRIIHPRVRARFRDTLRRFTESSADRIIVLDVPLLLGSELIAYCDVLIMVRAPFEMRLERVIKNRGWTRNELVRREASQPNLDEKERAADFFIENDGDLEQLYLRVDSLLERIQGSRGCE